MANRKLLESVSNLGVPLMILKENVDACKILADVVKSHDMRLWESFPALLANTSLKYQLDLQRVGGQLNKPSDKKAFRQLSVLSKVMYDLHSVQFTEFNKAFESFKKTYAGQDKFFKSVRDALKQDFQVSVTGVRLSTERLRNSFTDYLAYRSLEQQKQNAKHQEFSLEYDLSQVFSPKQKELFKKKLDGEKMTKTEREYYSRAVKKKVLALANSELHLLCRRLQK